METRRQGKAHKWGFPKKVDGLLNVWDNAIYRKKQKRRGENYAKNRFRCEKS